MIFGKKMSKQELGELRAINKLVKQERYLIHVIGENTSRVYKGQDFLQQHKNLLALLEEKQTMHISIIANRLGFEEGKPVEVDMETGAVMKGKPKVDLAEEAKEESK